MSDVEQVTRERKKAGCLGCSSPVMHVQIANFTSSGFKVYQWVPIGHQRPNGTRCTYLAETREKLWKTEKGR